MIHHLAVIIVSYNVCDLLRNCLASVQASAARTADRLKVDIIVVDNASADGSAAMVADEFPAVRLVALDHNSGFTGGNNLALQMLGFNVVTLGIQGSPEALSPPISPPDFVLLLNPDTEVDDDALWQMVQCLAERSDAGACGAHLSFGDGAFQHGAFTFPTLAQVLIDFFPLNGVPGMHRIHQSRVNGRYPSALWAGTEPFAVDFVLGAAMMVRVETIRRVGGSDDRYFMYCEEMDWAMRLQQAGWTVYAIPTARIIHYEGRSSSQVRWEAYVRLWRSRFFFYAKHAGNYPPGNLVVLRAVVRLVLAQRARRARRRFRKGRLDGTELAEELAAYKAVMRL